MYDIKELEQKWRKYKLKQYSNLIFYLLGASVVILSTPVLYDSYRAYQEKIALEKKQKIIERELALKREQERMQKARVVQNEPTEKRDTPAPEEVASLKPEKRKHITPKLDILVSNEPIDGDNPALTTNGIEFTQGTKVDRALLESIKSRFENTKDYDDAMFLAKYYYSQRAFKSAEQWAMQANLIDSSQDESWIIFSKSKAKQGHRADALRVLQAYFDRTGSMKIKKLIDKIRKGKKF